MWQPLKTRRCNSFIANACNAAWVRNPHDGTLAHHTTRFLVRNIQTSLAKDTLLHDECATEVDRSMSRSAVLLWNLQSVARLATPIDNVLFFQMRTHLSAAAHSARMHKVPYLQSHAG